MPSMRDLMATSKAAGQMAGAPPEAGMPPPGMMGPGGGAPPPEEGAPDLEGAIAALEAAVSDAAPEAMEDVMVHLNAIREIVSAPPEQKGEGEVVEPSPEPGTAGEAKNVEMTEK